MDRLTLNAFGGLSILLAGQPVTCSSAKASELLGYLLIHRDRPQSRESLASVLWPDHSAAASMRYLRQALWKLKRTIQPVRAGRAVDPGQLLEAGGGRDDDFPVSSEPGFLAIRPYIAAGSDLLRFEQIHASVRDTPGARLSDRQCAAIEAAVELYRGDLFATWQHNWCVAERFRLRDTLLGMLEQLMAAREAEGRHAEAIAIGKVLLRHDPARESGHLALMRLYHRTGHRLAALRQFKICRAALAEEFGVSPSAPTLALHAQVLADQMPEIPVQAQVRQEAVPAGRIGGPGPELVTTLRRVTQQVDGQTLASGATGPVGSAGPTLAGVQQQLDEIKASLSELHRILRGTG